MFGISNPFLPNSVCSPAEIHLFKVNLFAPTFILHLAQVAQLWSVSASAKCQAQSSLPGGLGWGRRGGGTYKHDSPVRRNWVLRFVFGKTEAQRG